MNKVQVDAVIVTYNKLNLLKESLNAVLLQSYPISKVFVIDNNSSDGTADYLDDVCKKDSRVRIIHLNENLGGAGGFNRGLRSFISDSTSAYVWVMDDDTVPIIDSLKQLVDGLVRVKQAGFLASNVRWTNGEPALMNVPVTVNCWNAQAESGLIEIRSASFVSILFSRNAILKAGLPISEFFIWGDDVEFTSRITKLGYKNYMVTESKVIHKMKENTGTDIEAENNKNRIKRYYYANRNTMYLNKKLYGIKGACKEFTRHMLELGRACSRGSKYKSYKVYVILRGTLSGIFFHPKVERM